MKNEAVTAIIQTMAVMIIFCAVAFLNIISKTQAVMNINAAAQMKIIRQVGNPSLFCTAISSPAVSAPLSGASVTGKVSAGMLSVSVFLSNI